MLLLSSGRQRESSVRRHRQEEEMTQTLKLNLNFWFLFLGIMALVLLQRQHLRHINNMRLKANSLGHLVVRDVKLHVFLQEPLLVLQLLKLRMILKQKYVFLLPKRHFNVVLAPPAILQDLFIFYFDKQTED